MKYCEESHAPHDIVVDPQSEPDEPTCAVCGHGLDMVFRHLEDIAADDDKAASAFDGWCESVDAEHWRDGDVCGMCGGAWVLP